LGFRRQCSGARSPTRAFLRLRVVPRERIQGARERSLFDTPRRHVQIASDPFTSPVPVKSTAGGQGRERGGATGIPAAPADCVDRIGHDPPHCSPWRIARGPRLLLGGIEPRAQPLGARSRPVRETADRFPFRDSLTPPELCYAIVPSPMLRAICAGPPLLQFVLGRRARTEGIRVEDDISPRCWCRPAQDLDPRLPTHFEFIVPVGSVPAAGLVLKPQTRRRREGGGGGGREKLKSTLWWTGFGIRQANATQARGARSPW